jgi:hypothetical protein
MKKILFILFIVSGLFFAKDVLAVSVYYSVGQDGATDRKVASTVTIASGVATFSAAQTGNIGVGDRVTYNTSVIAYISAKQSTTVWNLVTATGATPADITGSTVVSILREYTSLSAAEAGALDANHINSATGDLVTKTTILNLPCYYDNAADTTAVTIDGWITSASYYLKIYTPSNTSTEVNTTQRHDGKWNTGKYSLEIANASALISLEQYTRIEGIQIKLTGTTNDVSGFWGWADVFSENIIKNESTGTGLKGIYSSEQVQKIKNCIVYDFSTANSVGFMASGNFGNMHYWYNNTVYNCTYGFYISDYGTYVSGVLKNNLATACGTACYLEVSGGADWSYDYNASSDGTADDYGGTGHRVSQTFTFANEANDDFHLASNDAGARNYGIDLSADAYLPFSTDIDGQTRPGESVWDIGADEYVVAASTPAIWNVIKINGARVIINGARVIIP